MRLSSIREMNSRRDFLKKAGSASMAGMMPGEMVKKITDTITKAPIGSPIAKISDHLFNNMITYI